MSDLKEKPRTRDRRPAEVPHHPRVLTIAAIVTATALTIMMVWFWTVMTGKGFILTQEQQAEAQQDDTATSDLSDSDRARQQEDSQAQPTDNPGARRRQSGPPPAPDVSDTVTNDMELSEWSILAVNGVLHVSGTLTNSTDQPLSGTVRAYVYVDAVPVATAKTEIQNLKPGASQEVNLVSDSEWDPGEKVILLDFTPKGG